MTGVQTLTLLRYITNTTTTTLPDATFLRLWSERQKQFIVELSKLKEGYLETTATANLVASTETVALPSDLLRMHRIEVMLDGTNWYPVTIFDLNEADHANDATTVANEGYSTSEPYGDIMGDNIVLRPIPTANVTDGIKYYYVAVPADFSATSETPVIPEEYHRLLADLVTIDVRLMKSEIGTAQALQEENLIWQFLKNQVSPRVQSEDAVMKPLYVNYK